MVVTYWTEIGLLNGRWRAAVHLDGDLLAEGWGQDEAAARADLERILGRSVGGAAAPAGPAALVSARRVEPAPAAGGLREAIIALLQEHPEIVPHDRCSPQTKYMHRYRTLRGRSIGHEHSLKVQNLWVAAAGLPADLNDVPSRFSAGGRDGDGRHSNLKAMPDLCNADLICFAPRDGAEASRILDAVAALPSSDGESL
ncbi:hypothetical protein [Caenispirillum bisanense]|uniref:Uncharacterized protein n=1 Tax=Caenispirillum bisanense TaxID=414052 RepID=A0A286GCL2_9PROT|nr:hypothetical protein [Caenispirillum bisanense]SOD93263.1 hypothetical protein SAMN05421508_1038 [Caenispirillum bisanense]